MMTTTVENNNIRTIYWWDPCGGVSGANFWPILLGKNQELSCKSVWISGVSCPVGHGKGTEPILRDGPHLTPQPICYVYY